MNFANVTKARKTAVVIAALFMVCTCFAVMADSSSAEDSNKISVDGKWLYSTLNPRAQSDVISGSTLEKVTINTSTLESSYENKIIEVAAGSNVTANNTSFNGCIIYSTGDFNIKGTFSADSNTIFCFGGVALSIGKVVGNFTVYDCDFKVKSASGSASISFVDSSKTVMVKTSTSNNNSFALIGTSSDYITIGYTNATLSISVKEFNCDGVSYSAASFQGNASGASCDCKEKSASTTSANNTWFLISFAVCIVLLAVALILSRKN